VCFDWQSRAGHGKDYIQEERKTQPLYKPHLGIKSLLERANNGISGVCIGAVIIES